MLFTTFVVITALCLLIPFTRMYGVIGALVTAYFYPAQTLTLLGAIVLGGVVFIYYKRRNHMHDYILDALEMVFAWNLPDDELADAVNAQARLMAGIHRMNSGRTP